ncbi:MAG: transcriptional regulator, partial [Acetobacteraceae bacterium]|nr:transcriptional regulator [Acetobacteraceae bacterium]
SLGSGSRPIEIAWVDEDGRGESHLIKPAPNWRDWSVASQRVHGISQEMLEREGVAHARVARRAAAVLAGAAVFADQPSFDGYWLRMLLEAAGIRDEIPVLDVTLAYGQACSAIWDQHDVEGSLARARRIVAEAEEAEAMRQRVRHRALPDAEGLWWRWREVRRRAAAVVVGRP